MVSWRGTRSVRQIALQSVVNTPTEVESSLLTKVQINMETSLFLSCRFLLS